MVFKRVSWMASPEDFIIGSKSAGTYDMSSANSIDGITGLDVFNDKDKDGAMDRGEEIIATFNLPNDYAFRAEEHWDHPSHVIEGIAGIDPNNGEFNLYLGGGLFAQGEVFSMDYFFC